MTFFPGSSSLPELTTRRQTLAFSLLELMVVIAITILVAGFVLPAVTTLKSAGDVTSSAYTIKGVLESARSYAMANNTYTWVGFSGSIGSTVTGQVSMALLASNDGTNTVCTPVGSPPTPVATDSTTTSSIVIGSGTGTASPISKIITLSNSHIGDTGTPTNNGTDFESRASVASAYRISSAGTSSHTFVTKGVTFSQWIQFSPRGEATVNGGNTQVTTYAEVGLLPTHGNALASTLNIAAVQVGGFGGNVRIYRR